MRPGACAEGLLRHAGLQAGGVPMAQQAAADAARCLAGATPREQAHLAALQAWVRAGTGARCGDLGAHPGGPPARHRRVPAGAFRQFLAGAAGGDARLGAGVAPHWGEDLPGYNAILGCLCFANEECGHYTEAEEAGRAAIALDPGDLWSAHGVAHVMEMQGRRGEGLDWLELLAPHWEGGNNLRHHLWWHCGDVPT